jgi:hypothetical protein
MRFVRWIFLLAGIYGMPVVLTSFFREQQIGVDTPPPITHPEYYYGFLAVTLAWQVAFFIIASDPARFRPLMPVAVLEKLLFGVIIAALYLLGRTGVSMFVAGMIDLGWGVLFLIAWWLIRPQATEVTSVQSPVTSRGSATGH